MTFYNILLLCAVISFVSSQGDIAEKFKTSELVPDVIASPPGALLEVKYPSGVNVNLGNELTPTNVKDIPSVTWEANPEHFYTLLLLDPDAPSRENPAIRSVRHWEVVNIPGNNLGEGETLMEYIGSGPAEETKLHRYVFLLFKQTVGKGDFSAEPRACIKNIWHRVSFSAALFIEKYSLDLVAGNFYQAQYDDYVPILYTQFDPE
ncbi:Phosphatidylethanolamine-binding protein [Sergentomyia squamirostris]